MGWYLEDPGSMPGQGGAKGLFKALISVITIRAGFAPETIVAGQIFLN